MGYKTITFKLPTDFTTEQLQQNIAKQLHIKDFSFQIENKKSGCAKKIEHILVGKSGCEFI